MELMKIVLYAWAISSVFTVAMNQHQQEVFMYAKRFCITNGSSAIAINKQIDYISEHHLTKSGYKPPTNYICNFESENSCPDPIWEGWYKTNSIDGPLSQNIITDRRWEGFPFHKSEASSRGFKQYYHILNISSSNEFRIPFSVRIKQDAHLFLCDGDQSKTPSEANCYWIMIGSNEGQSAGIRKCLKGHISHRMDIYPQEPCKTMHSFKNSTSHLGDVSELTWKHFLIERSQNTLKLFKSQTTGKPYLELRDWEFSPNHLFINSYDQQGLWKIHHYSYLLRKTRGTTKHSIYIQDGQLCIFMFVAMCKMCMLEISFENKDDQVVYRKWLKFQVDTWQEVRIVLNNIHDSFLKMVISAKDNGRGAATNFWAIDDIRRCHEPEYRYLEHSNQPCEKLDVKGGKILGVDPGIGDINATGYMRCPEDTFGRICIPCKFFYEGDYCPEMKYCEYVSNTLECHCSAGYHQGNCIGCSWGWYGHGCISQCSRGCRSNCNYVSGQCDCNYSFQGKKCDELPQPYLKDPPKLEEEIVDSCSFSIENWDIVGSNRKSSSKDFVLQYKENGEQNNDHHTWKTQGYKHKMNYRNRFTIGGLKSDTEYSIRVLLDYPNRQNDTMIDSDLDMILPVTKCRTKCNVLKPDEIEINPGNVTASVKLEVDRNGCNIGKYLYSFEGQIMKLPGTEFVLHVEPYTNYKLDFLYGDVDHIIASIPFRTKEGVPSSINGVSVADGSSKYHNKLSWAEPQKKNGAIEYRVSYTRNVQHSGTIVCTDDAESVMKTTQFTEIELKDLKPYSFYTGYVWAMTKIGSGPKCSFKFSTVPLDELTLNETPRIFNITQAGDIVTIQFEKIACKEVKGPIIFDVSASCTNEWCKNITNIRFDILTNQQVNLSELRAFSNYMFVTKATRSGKVWTDIESKNFQTRTTVPTNIPQVDVVSKDETYITLRWKPPYPPTGIFAEYKILLNAESTWRNNESKVTPCHLWKDYECITLTGSLEKIQYYRIQILGRNEDPPNFKELHKLEVSTALGNPDPPDRLSYTITDENEILASWYHPTIMNGNLTKFKIRIKGLKALQIHEEKIVDWKNYSVTYFYKVPLSKLKSCKPFTFNVRSCNRRYESKDASLSFSTPPPKASISENDIEVVRVNNTVNVRFLKITSNWLSSMYVLLSEFGRTEDLDTFERKLRVSQNTRQKLEDPRLVFRSKNITKPFKVSPRDGLGILPNQDYQLIFFFVTKCDRMVTVKRLSKAILAQSSSSPGSWAFLLFLLVPVVGYIMYYKKLHRKVPKIWSSGDNTIDNINATDQLPLQPTPPIQKVGDTAAVHTVKTKVPEASSTHSKRVTLDDFQQYVRNAITDGTLEEQLELLPKGLLKAHIHGSTDRNISKNRYKNVIAYDHTRVKLKELKGEEDSDYINANYINGYKMSRVYIATQGPKASTLNDFWRMIWQENVKYIIMLANLDEGGKRKVEKYWPDINKTAKYGNISVQYLTNKLFANYEQREFSATWKDEERKITQLHFTSWPDHGIPLYPQSLVPFLEAVLKIPNNSRSPIVVHCSAGVGRTGTIILSDICLRMAASEGAVDFLSHLEQLRNQRVNLVDNIEQYKLAHLVVLECIFGMRTSIPCNTDMDKAIKELLESDEIDKQMRYIAEIEWQDRAMETDLDEMNSLICDEKNRFPDIVPVQNRIYLTCHPPSDDRSSYINAVQVDGFRSPGRYLVTQLPMPNTVKDFWRMVCEREVKVIIVIGTLDPSDKTICQFWPSENSKISPVDFINVTCLAVTSSEKSQTVEMKVCDSLKKIEFNVNMIMFKEWRNRDVVPTTVENFLLFLLEAESISRNMDNIIITCYDGVSASGLYIALSFLIEKMKSEHECDVCQAVRSIRQFRRQFISNQEQYGFLLKACLSYIKGFELYSNFTR